MALVTESPPIRKLLVDQQQRKLLTKTSLPSRPRSNRNTPLGILSANRVLSELHFRSFTSATHQPEVVDCAA